MTGLYPAQTQDGLTWALAGRRPTPRGAAGDVEGARKLAADPRRDQLAQVLANAPSFAGDIAAGFLPGAGALDMAGQLPSFVTGEKSPSMMENFEQGNIGTGIMQGMGGVGDAFYAAAPFTLGAAAIPGAILKAPRALQRALTTAQRAAKVVDDVPPAPGPYGTAKALSDDAPIAAVPIPGAKAGVQAVKKGWDDYARTVISNDVRGVSLIGSSTKGTGRDVDILYDLGPRELPANPFEAAEHIQSLIETLPVDLDTYDSFFKAGDRYFHVSSGAGRAVIENTEYAAQQAGKPIVQLGASSSPGIRAYHGSPHDFDKFDMSKIGTGEGAQAYGHGLYFSETEGVAKSYRDTLRRPGVEVFVDGKMVGPLPNGQVVNDPAFVAAYQKLIPDPDVPDWIKRSVLKGIRDQDAPGPVDLAAAKAATLKRLGDLPPKVLERATGDVDRAYASIGKNVEFRSPGRMYETRINASPDEFLDWDKPLSEQPKKIQDALAALEIGGEHPMNYGEVRDKFMVPLAAAMKGTEFERFVTPEHFLNGKVDMGEVRKSLANDPQRMAAIDKVLSDYKKASELRGEDILYTLAGGYNDQIGGGLSASKNPVDATEALRVAGIKGIRYKDAGSRAAGSQPEEIAQFTSGKNAGKWKVRSTTGEVSGPFDSKEAAEAFSEKNFPKPTSNYVVFDDSIIEILRKYGIAGLTAGAAGAAGMSANTGEAMAGETLPGGVPRREPYKAELDFFRKNPNVGGMAAEDNAVIINPFSKLTPREKESIAVNEASRVLMRSRPELRPSFDLTPEQEAAFGHYGSPDDVRATIAARILSGDPSALNATPEQKAFVMRLQKATAQ